MAPITLTAGDVLAKLDDVLGDREKLTAAVEQAVTAANAKATELGVDVAQPDPTLPQGLVGASAREYLADVAKQRAADGYGDPGSDADADRAEWGQRVSVDPDAEEVGTMQSVLDEAAAIVAGSRETDYGPAERNLQRIAGMWSAYLEHPITPRDVAWMMVQLKASRDRHRVKRDNLVDAAGYVALAEHTGGA